MPAFGDFAYLDYDSEDTPTFNTQRSYIAVYVTNTHLSKTAACAGGNFIVLIMPKTQPIIMGMTQI